MDITSHMQKVARMDAVHRRLDREADFELWYWMALDAGNQAMNAALHAAGVTTEEPELASQVNDIYMRQTEAGEWERVVKRGADIIHPQMSEFDNPIPEKLQEAIDALAAHYMNTVPDIGGATIVVSVSGVHDFMGYARTMRYLESLNEVESVDVLAVVSGRLRLGLKLHTGVARLRELIALESTLAEDAGDVDGALALRLLP